MREVVDISKDLDEAFEKGRQQILSELKELFKLELDNDVVNYNTLIKLRDFIE